MLTINKKSNMNGRTEEIAAPGWDGMLPFSILNFLILLLSIKTELTKKKHYSLISPFKNYWWKFFVKFFNVALSLPHLSSVSPCPSLPYFLNRQKQQPLQPVMSAPSGSIMNAMCSLRMGSHSATSRQKSTISECVISFLVNKMNKNGKSEYSELCHF